MVKLDQVGSGERRFGDGCNLNFIASLRELLRPEGQSSRRLQHSCSGLEVLTRCNS
jgi:hypothetical protein